MSVCDASVSPQLGDQFESGYYCSADRECQNCQKCEEHCKCWPTTNGEAWLTLAGAYAVTLRNGDADAAAIIFAAQQNVFIEGLMEKVA